MNPGDAPGWPGIAPRWTSSAKSGLGTALGPASQVWFTLSHGILNEVYYPRVDQAAIRDLGLIVTDGREFFSEEKRHARHQLEWIEEGVPAFRLVNTCAQGRYRIEKEVLADPRRDVVLQETRFVPLRGEVSDSHLYALLAPRLGNRGSGNTAWVSEYKGTPMLFAERAGQALALACSAPWLVRSAGFVGVSDGWQDLSRHNRMTWAYARAADGNVALTGEIDLVVCGGAFTLALGFGRTAAEAAQRARTSLLDGYAAARARYIAEWRAWQRGLLALDSRMPGSRDLYRRSMAVIRTHEAKRLPGGIIASLSVPWGFARGDADEGGYHLVWPRDLVEAAGALLAAGASDDARRVLRYLMVTQEADGHWPQNMWLDGRPYWSGIQMDETAFPILLADLLRRGAALDDLDPWPMVRRAAGYLVRNGPVTPQDRWEEDGGYSPFTLAAEMAALVVAADVADAAGEPATATYLRETADTWNQGIDRWTYVRGTELACTVGVEGYYARIAPPEVADAGSPSRGFVPIKNRPPDRSEAPYAALVSPDALALVRFGLRAADDPRIANTLRVIDAVLKSETATGPVWHRYNEDGYGEHEDGSPFDGTGTGRGWPLLAGERAHYELAAGNLREARRLQQVIAAQAGLGGLIPEQVWDGTDIPERELWNGRPAGSAMPLVWAHAEYVKLSRSLHDGRVFDTPPGPVRRYLGEKRASLLATWRFNHKTSTLRQGETLRIETLARALVHWSTDGWGTPRDIETADTGLGVHYADLATAGLAAGVEVRFTFFWPEAGRWEGVDFAVTVEAA